MSTRKILKSRRDGLAHIVKMIKNHTPEELHKLDGFNKAIKEIDYIFKCLK